ncbi:MAG TPA: pyrimidine-nucleoside phosphorylase [Bacillota bacterium]
MRMIDLIYKKRNGAEHSPEEIRFIVNGIAEKSIPDYQLAAWCMAVYFQGMSPREARNLAIEMSVSGETVDLSAIPGVKIDKHSTGGVGDKVSLVLAPLVAAAGAPVCKMSGRGLGHTGGTIDKLESIPGFKTEIPREDLFKQVKEVGIGLVGQTGNLVPADKYLYALRDVTCTVESIPLIAASIMSKKLAGGADGFVLDVKVGNGAFMKDLEEAKSLAELMVSIGKGAGKKCMAVLTGMDQPLGHAIGNALEVREAIAALKGQGPWDLMEVCLTLGAQMLILAGIEQEEAAARNKLEQMIADGAAWRTFEKWVSAQGGEVSAVRDENLLPTAHVQLPVVSRNAGYIAHLDTEGLGMLAGRLGAGRASKDDCIDHRVGLVIRKKLGDPVKEGEVLAEIHARTMQEAQAAAESLYNLVIVSAIHQPAPPLIYGYIV